jgi:hypothetical protein
MSPDGKHVVSVIDDSGAESHFTIPAESKLREHVVFHVQSDYVRLQAQHFRVRKRVAD